MTFILSSQLLTFFDEDNRLLFQLCLFPGNLQGSDEAFPALPHLPEVMEAGEIVVVDLGSPLVIVEFVGLLYLSAHGVH